MLPVKTENPEYRLPACHVAGDDRLRVCRCYEFPIENRWKVTVVGTPPGYRAELPEKIPLKKRRIEILDREVPEALWHDQELRYSYALQKDPAPLVFLIAGTGATHVGGENTSMGKAFHDAGFPSSPSARPPI